MTSRIISVSRRTDIPAFYGDWFMNRLKKGFAGYVNPYGGPKHLVSLSPENVACFVFWSKNFEPFLNNLKKINAKGYNCYFQFTITALPEVFESNVVDTASAIETLKYLSQMYSPNHINWRYDPVVLSSITDSDFHLKKFEDIASKLQGHVERCYFSFPTLYGKVKRNLDKFQKEKGVSMLDPEEGFKIKLANHLAEISNHYGMSMNSCCGDYLVGGKIQKAHCVDGDIIGNLFGYEDNQFEKGATRKGCGCSKSTDIGAYDTCPHGCIYCYANINKEKAKKAFENCDVNSAFLGRSKEQSDSWISEIHTREPKPNMPQGISCFFGEQILTNFQSCRFLSPFF